MRLFVARCLVMVSLLILAGDLPFARAFAQVIQPFAATCAADTEISPEDHTAIDQAAMQFVQTVLNTNPAQAYSSFTAEAKRNVSPDNFNALVQNGIQPWRPFKDLHVSHAYLPAVVGGTREQRVVCGDLSSPNSWVAVTAKPGSKQAHVVVEGETINNVWAFVIWLLQEQGRWNVQYFQVVPVAIVGKTTRDVLEMARVEKERHHDFNAYVLYASALQLAGRGPHLQLGIDTEIHKEIAKLQRPRDIQGEPPYTWKFGDSSFKILVVGPIGVGGRIYLNIEQDIAQWTNDNDADRRNHELIVGFKKAYPEYSDVFAGFVVAAREHGGPHGYRTIDVKQESAR